MIYLGADHRGFQLKETLKTCLSDKGIEVKDLGALVYDKEDDYPDFAAAVAKEVAKNPSTDKGMLLCGSGHGVDMVANKFRGIRAALAFNATVAIQSREHEDANVLVLPADWLTEEDAEGIALSWLETGFDGAERNKRRINKINELENS